jgi:hypothetical protein
LATHGARRLPDKHARDRLHRARRAGDAPRPRAADFSFNTDETTSDALIAKVSHPTPSQGTRLTRLILVFRGLDRTLVVTRAPRDHRIRAATRARISTGAGKAKK